MLSTAAYIGPALVAVTPYEVGGLSEEEARAIFQQYRFVENGGEPFCPKCGCDAIYTYKARPIFKCKSCDLQFTLTSHTQFRCRKLKFKQILAIFAAINVACQGCSSREILRNIRSIKNYKTVFVWVHKIRAALKRVQATRQLCGEVEVDGAEIGGYIRPPNTKKERTDLRKYPYRASDRKMNVVLARERGGLNRGWVAKQEQHAVKPFMESLEPGAVVFSDCGKWSPIRQKFPLFQVSHREMYYSPEACTNFAESGNNVLRVLATIHRRITHNYLDLYVAQLAWRLDAVRMTDEQAFGSLMGAMMANAPSPLAGYFKKKKHGGKKRLCEIVLEDGSPGLWTPPPKKKRLRPADAVTPAEETSALRMARSDRWNQGFTFVSARAYLEDKTLLPARPGVYVLLFSEADASRILARSGYFPDPSLPAWRYDGFQHLYTGEAYFLRQRLEEHLAKDSSRSPLRETLLALHWSTDALHGGPVISDDRHATDAALNAWMLDRVLIGFKVCGYGREVERNMLKRAASPLNIRDRQATPYSELLRSLRKRFRDEVSGKWPPVASPTRPRRR